MLIERVVDSQGQPLSCDVTHLTATQRHPWLRENSSLSISTLLDEKLESRGSCRLPVTAAKRFDSCGASPRSKSRKEAVLLIGALVLDGGEEIDTRSALPGDRVRIG